MDFHEIPNLNLLDPCTEKFSCITYGWCNPALKIQSQCRIIIFCMLKSTWTKCFRHILIEGSFCLIVSDLCQFKSDEGTKKDAVFLTQSFWRGKKTLRQLRCCHSVMNKKNFLDLIYRIKKFSDYFSF